MILTKSCFGKALVKKDLSGGKFDSARFYESRTEFLTGSQTLVSASEAIKNYNHLGMSLTKASRATAYREMLDLLKKNVLEANEGQGRSVSYGLKW